jgi:hypothetical protein
MQRANRRRVFKSTEAAPGGADPILSFSRKLPAAEAAICRELRAAIDGALPAATSRIWHAAPVWFVGDTPVVGYSVPARGGVSLLFWNGQAFGDPALEPIGKFKAAQMHYDAGAPIDTKPLRGWLEKAGTLLWDLGEVRERRARAKRDGASSRRRVERRRVQGR